MPVELLLPRVKVPVLPMPSYVKLAMAFGVGAGATLFDKSRYRSHGAITTAAWAAGLHGYCLDFNAANPDYVEIPAAHTQLNFISQDFSGVARIRCDNLAGNNTIFCRGLSLTDGYFWYISSTGYLEFRTCNAPAEQRTYSNVGDFVINTWYTVGFTRNGASVKLYRNGVELGYFVVGVHIDPATCARTAKIGIFDDLTTLVHDGKIEFLRIFQVALAASEHLAWHNALA